MCVKMKKGWIKGSGSLPSVQVLDPSQTCSDLECSNVLLCLAFLKCFFFFLRRKKKKKEIRGEKHLRFICFKRKFMVCWTIWAWSEPDYAFSFRLNPDQNPPRCLWLNCPSTMRRRVSWRKGRMGDWWDAAQFASCLLNETLNQSKFMRMHPGHRPVEHDLV